MPLTAADLRSHYGNDEFSELNDAHLDLALARASSTVDRYVQKRPGPGTRADKALEAITLTIARAYAHDELPLDEAHPIIRELNEALRWLERLASGQASLPVEDGVTAAPAGIHRPMVGVSVAADPAVFTRETFRKWP